MPNAKKIFASLAVAGATSVAVIGGASAALGRDATTFSHGAPAITTSASGPLLSLPNAAVGARATRSVTISNTGTSAGVFSVTARTTGSDVFANALVVTVSTTVQGVKQKLYDGPLSSFRSVDLGTLPAGAARRLDFQVTLPSTGSSAGDNALQGLSARATLTWAANQA